MILHAIWMVDSAYGYLKSTFANAALFNTVTRILLAIQTSSQNACATVDVSVSVVVFCGAGLISAGDFMAILLSTSCSESANKGVSLADDDDMLMMVVGCCDGSWLLLVTTELCSVSGFFVQFRGTSSCFNAVSMVATSRKWVKAPKGSFLC